MGSQVLIQMPLVGEGVDVWRPVSSWPLGGELFLVALQPIPESEDWAFGPGEVVRCVPCRFADGDVQETAVARVPEEPATVQCWLEFHDSVLQRVESGPGNVRLQLDGYIHRWERRAGVRFGLGMIQPVSVNISRALAVLAPHSPVDIAGGSMLTSAGLHRNVIPVPFRAVGSARVTLELVDGSILEAAGVGCEIAPSGDARFVEVLEDDMDPDVSA